MVPDDRSRRLVMMVITMTNDPVTDSGAPSGTEVLNGDRSVVIYSGGPRLMGLDG